MELRTGILGSFGLCRYLNLIFVHILMCLHCLYGIYIHTTEVFMHAIKEKYLVYLDFGIFENDLIYIEILH